MWWKSSTVKRLIISIMILIILLLLGELSYLWNPVKNVLLALIPPVFLTTVLYYLLRPVSNYLQKKMPKTASVLIVLTALTGLLFSAVYFGAPMLKDEMTNFIETFPQKVEDIKEETKEEVSEKSSGSFSYEELKNKMTLSVNNSFMSFNDLLPKLIKTLSAMAVTLLATPFLLFFMLRDDSRFRPLLLKWLPSSKREEGNKLLIDIDESLSQYIRSQAFIALADGVLMYIGYLIIGLSSPLLLALFVVPFAVIPFLGPLIGVIPAVAVAMMESPELVMYTLIVFTITQQLEGNLIAPLIFNRQLKIHPLTIILLLIGAGAFQGFLSMIIVIPLYVILKVTTKNLIHFYKLKHD